MRSYFVRRKNAPFLFTNILISFALTVVVTRVVLALTGYVQISNEVLHIAHLNWGGILLLFAVVMLALFRGRLVLILGAILGGVGWGLFIDEIGKFITVNNDYFFRPAAALIYIVFLLLFLALLYFRKDDDTSIKTRLYFAIDYLEEIIENDFDVEERMMVEDDLESVVEEAEEKQIRDLAVSLLKYVRSQQLPIRQDDIFYKFHRLQKSINENLQSIPEKFVLSFFNILLIFRVVISVFWLIALMVEYVGIDLSFLTQYFEAIDITHTVNISLFLAMNALRVIISIVMLYGLRQLNDPEYVDKHGALKNLTISLWVSILFLDVFDFYFNQFAAVFGTLVDISLLAFIRDYSEKLAKEK